MQAGKLAESLRLFTLLLFHALIVEPASPAGGLEEEVFTHMNPDLSRHMILAVSDCIDRDRTIP